MTNRVYRVALDDADGDLVLRIAGEGTEEYIDRKVEAHNALAAHRAGISPEVLFCDSKTGIMLMRHVAATTMTPNLFRSTPGTPTRAALAFKPRG